MIKRLLFLFISILNCNIHSQTIFYPLEDKNTHSPKIIKTSDGGYLITSYYSTYTPSQNPIEGGGAYRLIKIDVNGNEEWSVLNSLPFINVFETNDGGFISISSKHSANTYTCQGVSYQWGSSAYFVKLNSEGDVLNSFEINPGCENTLKDVIKINDKFATIVTYYNDINRSSPETHLFYFDDEGNILDEKVFPNEEYKEAHFFLDDTNTLNLLYLDDEDRKLVLNTYDVSFNQTSQLTFENLDALIPQYSTSELDMVKLLNGNYNLYVKYFATSPIYNRGVKVILFDSELNFISEKTHEMSKRTNRIFQSNSDISIIAHQIEDSNTSEKSIELKYFDETGGVINSEIIDIANSVNDRPYSLALDYNNNLIILGDINCCNFESSVGPSKAFVSFGNTFLGLESETLSEFKIYPNPVSQILHFKSKKTISNIKVFDNLGRLLREVRNYSIVDVQNLKQGVYFFRIEDYKGNVVVKKVIKE